MANVQELVPCNTPRILDKIVNYHRDICGTRWEEQTLRAVSKLYANSQTDTSLVRDDKDTSDLIHMSVIRSIRI